MVEHDENPDRWQDEQREDAAWEKHLLQRHLDRGLAGDAEIENRVSKLGSSDIEAALRDHETPRHTPETLGVWPEPSSPDNERTER